MGITEHTQTSKDAGVGGLAFKLNKQLSRGLVAYVFSPKHEPRSYEMQSLMSSFPPDDNN